MVSDHGSYQGDIVGVFARASANSAFPLGVGQIFVGFNFFGLNTVGGNEDVTGADRQAIPDTVWISVLGGDILLQNFGFQRLGNFGFDKLAQISDVDS